MGEGGVMYSQLVPLPKKMILKEFKYYLGLLGQWYIVLDAR